MLQGRLAHYQRWLDDLTEENTGHDSMRIVPVRVCDITKAQHV